MRAKIDFAVTANHVTMLLSDDDETLRDFLGTFYKSACLLAGEAGAVQS
jgi:hypothetical protein